MERHFHEELAELKQRVIHMASLVVASVTKATEAFMLRKPELAELVFDYEKKINQLEMEIDETGHSLFAVGQPMAIDLRFVTAILKMNTDLERLGDHAVNIAERALLLCQEPQLETNLQLTEMTEVVLLILNEALDSFVKNDAEIARDVLKKDDGVDAYNDQLCVKMVEVMENDPLTVKTGVKLIRISHDLERIADLAGNIAEDVIYMKQGKEVRHRIESKNKSS